MFDDRCAKLEQQKQRLIDYARMKLDSGDDWHGVQDAATDIREIDARIDELSRVKFETLASRVGEASTPHKHHYRIEGDKLTCRMCGESRKMNATPGS